MLIQISLKTPLPLSYTISSTLHAVSLSQLLLHNQSSLTPGFFFQRANAKLVYACEWNPNAIEALQHNLQANSVSDCCIVLEGDNRIIAPKDVADRVCLGLIPTSEGSWVTTVRALRGTALGKWELLIVNTFFIRAYKLWVGVDCLQKRSKYVRKKDY